MYEWLYARTYFADIFECSGEIREYFVRNVVDGERLNDMLESPLF